MNRTMNQSPNVNSPFRGPRRWINTIVEAPDAMAWIIFAAVASNTIAYTLVYSDPVIRSDTWYFLDVFVSKALDGTLHLGDFFVQRGGLDHAQPLRKLILLMNLHHFHLDLRYQAVVGWFAAVVSLLLLRRLVFWGKSPDKPFTGLRVWAWAGMCVAFVSLNSTTIWGWPLVTGAYTSYLLLFATLIGLWRWLKLGRPLVLVIFVLALDIAADDRAELANIACLITLGITAWQNTELRKRTLEAAAMLIACLIVVRIGYALVFTPPEGLHIALGQRLGDLWENFLVGGWWQWMLIPLAASVASTQPLKHFVGGHYQIWQIMIGSGLLLAHIWFWYRALRKRPIMTASMFAAITLMLLFYAFVVGIIYARVSTFGNSYLEQPRYAMVYSFNIVALLLMCASCHDQAEARLKPVRVIFAGILITLCAWQIPLSHRAHVIGPYLKVYHQKMAWQIGEMARHPGHKPANCLPVLVVCNYKPQKRTKLVGLLKSHKLNVFSPTLQRVTGLDPNRPPK